MYLLILIGKKLQYRHRAKCVIIKLQSLEYLTLDSIQIVFTEYLVNIMKKQQQKLGIEETEWRKMKNKTKKWSW